MFACCWASYIPKSDSDCIIVSPQGCVILVGGLAGAYNEHCYRLKPKLFRDRVTE